MKRVLSIQDISCLGRCSTTIALPVISAMGVETVILPTALLSTHTMFKDFTYKDLTDQLMPIAQHWKKQNVHFDAIYTGYLGSIEEIQLVENIIAMFKEEDTLVFIDPVMADKGKLYSGFQESYVVANVEYCSHADVIVPNITEAALMTGNVYKETYDETYILDMLHELADFGSDIVAITGVSLEEGKTGVYGYDAKNQTTFKVQTDLVGVSYHGTGDLFSSAAVGALVQGIPLKNAFQLAADYTVSTIKATLEDQNQAWYGVSFEKTLPELSALLKKYRMEK